MYKRYGANWTGLRNLKAQKFGNQISSYVSRWSSTTSSQSVVAQVRQDSIFSSTVWLHYEAVACETSVFSFEQVCLPDGPLRLHTDSSQPNKANPLCVGCGGWTKMATTALGSYWPQTANLSLSQLWRWCHKFETNGVINCEGTYSIRCGLWLAMNILQLKTGFINCHEVQWITWSNGQGLDILAALEGVTLCNTYRNVQWTVRPSARTLSSSCVILAAGLCRREVYARSFRKRLHMRLVDKWARSFLPSTNARPLYFSNISHSPLTSQHFRSRGALEFVRRFRTTISKGGRGQTQNLLWLTARRWLNATATAGSYPCWHRIA